MRRSSQERGVKKYLDRILSVYGYKLISTSEYDRLQYAINHKPQTKAHSPLSAMQMKTDILRETGNPVIFDIGAHVGNTIKEYLDNFAAASIYAFEPTPATYAELKDRYSGSGNVKCFQNALSDKNGKIMFHINQFSPTNSMLASNRHASEYWGEHLIETIRTTTVQSVTLDSFCQQKNITHIDILKLDVQGAELRALTGAKRLLKGRNIKIVYLETIFVPTYREQAPFFKIGEYLDGYGYTLNGIFNLTYGDRIKQADMIFCPG